MEERGTTGARGLVGAYSVVKVGGNERWNQSSSCGLGDEMSARREFKEVGWEGVSGHQRNLLPSQRPAPLGALPVATKVPHALSQPTPIGSTHLNQNGARTAQFWGSMFRDCLIF